MASLPQPGQLPNIALHSPPPSNSSLPGEHGKGRPPPSLPDDTTGLQEITHPQGQLQNDQLPPSPFRQNVFMVFITLTQLVQMIPLGAGINSSLSIGEALGATRVESVWIVASYPLTQGTFVLIGKCLYR